MSTDALWTSVHQKEWNLNQTLALLQLSARDIDVRCELPRIVAMLESDSLLDRVYGWDALRLVFSDEMPLVEEYDPNEPADLCRQKIATLHARTHNDSV